MKKELLIIGFGNQARAWAQNLRDNDYSISIFLRDNSKSKALVSKLGFDIASKSDLIHFQNIALLTPDDTHLEILKELTPLLKENATIIYAHGFSLFYEKTHEKFTNFNHALLAPKAIASELRFQFESGSPLGGVYSTEYTKENFNKEIITQIGADLGLTYLHESSSEQETIADLFSEQSILCSTLPYAAMKSFNKLVENGIDTEVAYFECWYELKLIVDTMVKLGPYEFFKLISPNALIGSEIGKSVLFDHEYDKKLEDLFQNIKNETFTHSLKDINQDVVRDEVLEFWKKENINITHLKLKAKLFKEKV